MTKKKILIVEARFYEALTDALVDGAVAEIDAAGHTYERIAVPGVLEIPPAIIFAMDTGQYDAFVALGVVIRGETTHYDTVCAESARGLMDIGIKHSLAIGNGIQTVENEAQAWARCDKNDKNKGGGAALAALTLLTIREDLKGDK
ncbi:MAG: 6,7-dimethyl-8-ribityllumazine synthase [Candidatus Micropelagos thuwalensis]